MDHEQRFRASKDGFRWEGVAELAYKQAGSAPFRDISRQVLFEDPSLGCQLRYFEMKPGGYSTLERHQHVHAVMILRGHGACLVGSDVRQVKQHDLISIPPLTWHQFRAAPDQAMGFLCMVNATRDKPQLPSEAELRAMCADPKVAAFVSGER